MSRLDKTMGTQGTTPEEMAPEDAPENRAAASWSDEVGLTSDELQIPYLTLAQGMSKSVEQEKAKVGEWVIQGYPAEKSVIIVPLRFGMSRNYSYQNDKKQLVTSCYAPTAPKGQNHGIALLPDGPGIPCDTCPLAEWQPTDKVDDRGRAVNDPPPCKESYDFLVWSDTHQSFAKVQFRSSSLKPGKLLATIAQARGLAQFAVKLTSVRKTSNGFTYPVPEIEVLTGNEWAEVIETGQQLKLALTAGA